MLCLSLSVVFCIYVCGQLLLLLFSPSKNLTALDFSVRAEMDFGVGVVPERTGTEGLDDIALPMEWLSMP